MDGAAHDNETLSPRSLVHLVCTALAPVAETACREIKAITGAVVTALRPSCGSVIDIAAH
eukprot:528583-Prymnesium_polylepis.1